MPGLFIPWMPPRLLALTESLQLFWKCIPRNFHLSLPSYSIMYLAVSVFPSSWKVASVVPVCKGAGECSESTNYRPISLLPIISKIFECSVNQQLLGYLEDNHLLTDCQYGFRHSRSTGDLLSLITDHFNGALDRRGETRVVTLDISKAFDKVWYTGLLHKLQSYYGVSGRMLSIISVFLSNRKLRVVLKGQSSPTRSINSGVPHGSVLGLSCLH